MSASKAIGRAGNRRSHSRDRAGTGGNWTARAHRAGEPGIPAREAIRSVAEALGLEL